MSGRGSAAAPLLVGVAVLGFYLITLAPSLVWADGGRLQTDAITGSSLYWRFDEVAAVATDGWPFDHLGVAAWDHPLWVVLGHGLTSLGLGDPARTLNLLSAAPAAFAAAMVFAIIVRLGGSRWGAAAGSLALAVSHVYWFHAVTAEVYALHALFMTVLVWLALRWPSFDRPRLAVAGFLVGLGFSNHVMLLLTALPVAVYVAVRDRRTSSAHGRLGWQGWAGAAAAFVLGSLLWLVQFGRMVRVAGLPVTASLATGFPWLGERWPGSGGGELLRNAGSYLTIALYQFGPFGLAAAGYGAVLLCRRRPGPGALLVALFAVHAGFSANYEVADRFAFHLPSFLVLAVVLGYGVGDLLLRLRSAVGGRRSTLVAALVLVWVAAVPVGVYRVVPGALHRAGVSDADVGIGEVGDGARDGIAYFFDPDKRGDDSAERFGRAALSGLAPGATVLVAWPRDLETYVTLRHFQLTEGRRLDVTLDLMLFTGLPLSDSVAATARAEAGCRPVYLASGDPATYPIQQLEQDFDLTPEAHLVRLRPRRPSELSCPVRAPADRTITELLRTVRR